MTLCIVISHCSLVTRVAFIKAFLVFLMSLYLSYNH